jgi:hypothetical protein
MISYIGIDLGQKGAITVQHKLPASKPTWEIFPFYQRHGEETRMRTLLESEFYDLLFNIVNRSECYVTIERPMMFSKGLKAVASLHEHFGLTKGILIGLGVTSFWYPTPVQWKKLVKAPGSDKVQMLKNASKITKARNLSPETADSVLICEACRLHFQ